MKECQPGHSQYGTSFQLWPALVSPVEMPIAAGQAWLLHYWIFCSREKQTWHIYAGPFPIY